MANLKEIRNRIASVASTMQITSAMKMVSAAKLKRAQDAILRMRPYSEKLQEILQNVSGTLDLSENGFSEVRDVKNVLIIPIASNRGLCGGFNHHIVKDVALMLQKYVDQNVTILPIGKKVYDAYKHMGNVITTKTVGSVDDMFADLNFSSSSKVAQYAMESFLSKKYDKVIVIYNKFINAAVQEVVNENFLPIQQNTSDVTNTTALADYIYEPSKKEIVEDLIPKSLKTQLFKALLDSVASEHGARMVAMNKATDNASELKRNLTISYNKARQAAITNEILEIVGGAEALKG